MKAAAGAEMKTLQLKYKDQKYVYIGYDIY